MNKNVRMILVVIGLLLTGYGIYTLVTPETSISIGDLSLESQENTNSFITIAIGIASIVLSQFAGKKL